MCACLVTLTCPALCNPMDCSPPGLFVHGDSPGKNTRMGCHALLQGSSQPRPPTLQADSLLSEPPGKPIPSPGDLPSPGIEPGSPALQEVSLPTELSGKPFKWITSNSPLSCKVVCFFCFLSHYSACGILFPSQGLNSRALSSENTE